MGNLLGHVGSTFFESKAAVKALKQGCDPGPLLQVGKARMADEKLREASVQMYGTVVLNYMDAALAAGLNDARMELRSGIREGDSSIGPAFWALYSLHISHGHVLSERWEKATQTQNRAMEYFNRGGAARAEEEFLRWALCANGYALQIHYGHIEGLEEQIQQLLETAPDPWHTVECHVLLGKYYLAAGRPDEARKALEYAAAHGNKLFAKIEAEELLRELAGEGISDRRRVLYAKRDVDVELEKMCHTCDPNPALAACQAALSDQAVLRADGDVCGVIRLYACAALINLGRYDEARAQMEQMWLGEELEEEPAIKILQLHRGVILDTAQEHLKEAAQKQNEAMKLFRECGEPTDWRRGLSNSGSSLQIKLGQLDGVEERAKGLLETAEDEFDRVIAHMLMGRYLLAVQRKDEAVEHLRYAAEHGGKLHQQREAEELLKGL